MGSTGSQMSSESTWAVLKQQGHQDALASSEQKFRAMLDESRTCNGDQHLNTLITMHNLATLLFELENTSEAATLQEEVVQGKRATLGEEHWSTLASIRELGLVYKAQGKLQQALPLLEEAHNGRLATLGEDHPNTKKSLDELRQIQSQPVIQTYWQ